MRKFVFLALSSALLGACSVTPSMDQSPSKVLGTLELQFGGSTDPVFQSASCVRTAALTPKPDTSISASFVSFITRDKGGVRTLTAVYNLTNNTNSAFQNLSLVAYAKTGNSNSSALKNINAFSGSPSSTNVYGVKPAHGTNGSVAVSEFNSDLQAYTQTEASDFTTAARTAGVMTNTEYALEYGFVARQSGSSHLRSIAAGGTGRVSLSMKIPTTADVNSGTRFTMTFVVANNDAAHVVQSLEEPVNGTAAIARAAAVGSGAQVRILPTSTSSADPQLLLNPRTAGTTATPLGRIFTGTLTYTQLGINTPIPDGQGSSGAVYGAAVSRTFSVPAIAGTVAKLTLRSKITHDYSAVLRIRLTSPSTTVRSIFEMSFNDVLTSSAINMNATFDDASTNTIISACGNSNSTCIGAMKPFTALSGFNGQNAAGNWIVQVDDGYADGFPTGTLNELELVITIAP